MTGSTQIVARAALLLMPWLAGSQTAERTIQGIVRAENGEPLAGVVVQLKDVQNLQIRSYITERGGAYRFSSVLANRDFELKASFRERWTSTKYVSHFSEGNPLTIDLTIKRME
jgi:hypothetical protein